MSLLIFNISLKSLYPFIYSILHFLSFIFLSYFVPKKSSRNEYLFTSDIIQIFYLCFYMVEKSKKKDEPQRESTISNDKEFLDDEIVGDKFLSEKDLFETSYLPKEIPDQILLPDKFIINFIFIFIGIISYIKEKYLYFFINEKRNFQENFNLIDMYSSFYYGLYSLVVFATILIVKKILLNNYSAGVHQKMSILILLVLCAVKILFTLLDNIYNNINNITNTFLIINVIIIPVFMILEGIKFMLVKYLMTKHNFNIYLILFIIGFLCTCLNIANYYFNNLFSNKKNEIFKIGFINDFIKGVPTVIFLVAEKFFLIKSINVFSPSYAAFGQKFSDFMIFIFQNIYFSHENYKNFGVTSLANIIIEIFGIITNFIFVEIIIIKAWGLEKGTNYHLRKRAIKNYHTSMVLFKDEEKKDDRENPLNENILT